MVPGSEALNALTSSGLPEILRVVLAKRGIVGSEALERFFNPSIVSLLPPDGLAGVSAAVELLLETDGRIVVFGDYDCDGICASAILVSVLEKLGKEVSPFLPDRLKEGYGMSTASVSRMLCEYPDVKLVVTVDNGVNSVEEVAALREKGVKVVVTDHHLPGAVLPECEALVNPKVSAPPEMADLCGAGVAFMVAAALVGKARGLGLYSGPNLGGPLLVLAGLATITDLMPLSWQNRIIVSESLRRFHACAPLGMRELYARAAKTAAAVPSSRDFAFMLGPRINASGRIASGMEALELILCNDREIVRECARIVDMRNHERKEIEQRMVSAALEKVVPGAPAQVIDLPDGHPGVAGIIASRVMERLASAPEGAAVPVCIVAGGKGSARAPAGINIRDAMEFCSETLERFGGHAAAGGFSVKDGMIDAFRERLCGYCRDLAEKAGGAADDADALVDAWLSPGDLTVELAGWVAKMEPFGEGNPEPVFGLRGVELADAKPMGQEGRHLSLAFRNRAVPRAVWWNHGDEVEKLRAASGGSYDITFRIALSDYGERHVELRLTKMRESGGDAGKSDFNLQKTRSEK